MSAFLRWRFQDPYATGPTSAYTFPINPNAMTSPFRKRNIQAKGTTSVDGADILIEGRANPAEWTFTGDILDAAHYEALRSWVYDRPGRRIYVYDHYGRRLICVLTSFDVQPKRSVGKYWRHEYTISAIVTSVSQATVGEVAYEPS